MRLVIEEAPLQIYSSALIFTPENNIVRKHFENCVPSWIYIKPKVQENWNATLQTLKGHGGWIFSVAFSHDSRLLASASGDNTVKIWDASTGSLQQSIVIKESISRLLFDSTNSNLITDKGHFKVNGTRLTNLHDSSREGGDKSESEGLGVYGS